MQVIVTAMHRSGSSLCTRLLSFMGIHLGPGNALLPPQPDNPKGFWERSDVQILHDQVLGKLNRSWYDIAEFDLKAANEEVFDFFKIRAEKIIQELETWRPWVFFQESHSTASGVPFLSGLGLLREVAWPPEGSISR